MRAASGQAASASCAGAQVVGTPPRDTASDAGSVTAVSSCALWPTGWVIAATNGTRAPWPVSPGPPITADTFGPNGSLPQALGVNDDEAVAVFVGAP